MDDANAAARADSGTSSSATGQSASSNGALGGGVSLSPLMFDESLSFLADLDAIGDSDAAPTSSQLLSEAIRDRDAASELVEDMLSLAASAEDIDVDLSGVQLTDFETEAAGTGQFVGDGHAIAHTDDITENPKLTASTTRLRAKDELTYLRAQVAELENELAAAKQATTSSGAEGTPSAWEGIAKRQLDQKQRAEVENTKLRGLLEGQLRVARSLEKLLRKRSLVQSDSLFLENKRRRSAPLKGADLAREEIRGRIHLQFDDVDAVMKQCGLAQVDTDAEDVRASSDECNAIFMQMGLAKVLPFPLADVAEAVWQCTSAGHIELHNGYFGSTRRSDTQCDLQFSVNLRVRRSEASVHVHGVGSRRTETSRSMIVFESVGITEGALFAGQRIVCHERGYILIEHHATPSGAPSTIVKACVRMWPELEGDEFPGRPLPQTGLFVDLVVGSYNQNTKTLMQAIENLLLASSRQSSPASSAASS